MSKLPEGWRAPTQATISEQLHGYEHGLVPAGHSVLRSGAELVPQDEISGAYTRQIVEHMAGVIAAMNAVKRPIVGLAAPQIGESARIILVPAPKGYVKELHGLMAVINPVATIADKVKRKSVPHGCFSANEVFARNMSAQELVLGGFDLNGEQIEIKQTGFAAVVAEHEIHHLNGIRAADIATENNTQLDWRPSDLTNEYRKVVDRPSFLTRQEWPHAYPYAQWEAVKEGEFVITDFNN